MTHSCARLVQAGDGPVHLNTAVALANQPNERRAHRRIVDDPFFRNLQRRDAAAVRFDLAQFRRVQPAQPGEAVGMSARFELVEARDLVVARRDDDLAADLVCDVMRTRECSHLANAGDGELRLRGARRVVEPRVQHAAVVP